MGCLNYPLFLQLEGPQANPLVQRQRVIATQGAAQEKLGVIVVWRQRVWNVQLENSAVHRKQHPVENAVLVSVEAKEEKRKTECFNYSLPCQGTFYSGEFQDEPGNTGCNTCSGGESGTNTIGATSEGEACSDASNLPLVLGPAIAGPCCCLLIPFLLWRRKKKKKEKELEEELRNDYEIPERRRRMVSSGIPGTTGVINPLAGSGTDDGCTSKGSSSMLAATVIPPRHQNGDEEEHARDPYGDKKGFGPISSRNLVVDPNKSEPNSSPTAAKISSTGYSSD